MSLLQYIPDVIDNDPELAEMILNYENSFILVLVTCTLLQQPKKRRKRKRSMWVRPYLQCRKQQGHYNNLVRELANEDPDLYRNFLRLNEDLFSEIVERVLPYIEKNTT